MTIRLGVADIKARLSEVLHQVGAGERVVVERRGRPVALLRAYDPVVDADEPRGWFEDLNGALAEISDFESIMTEILESRRMEG